MKNKKWVQKSFGTNPISLNAKRNPKNPDKAVKWDKEPREYKDPDYLEWLHATQSCIVCGSRPIELHHLKLDRKRNDNEVVPLCALHHRGSEFSPHGAPYAWRVAYMDNRKAIEIAERLYREYKG